MVSRKLSGVSGIVLKSDVFAASDFASRGSGGYCHLFNRDTFKSWFGREYVTGTDVVLAMNGDFIACPSCVVGTSMNGQFLDLMVSPKPSVPIRITYAVIAGA